MEAYEPLISLGLALVIGLVIGLEREQSRPDPESGEPFLGGVRTYPVFSLLGASSMLLSRALGPGAGLLVGAGVVLLVAIGYASDVRSGRHNLTSRGAFLVAYVLGALATTEGVIEPLAHRLLVLFAVAITVTFLLSVKAPLHSFVQRLSPGDVLGTLKFLIVAAVVLPLLPNEAMGPLEALNPFQIGLLAVFISGIGFVGYLAMRLLGPHRGMALTGLLGGLVSSTAVTLSFSGRARERPELVPAAVLAVVMASSIMFGRVIVEVAVVAPELLRPILFPMSASLFTGLFVSAGLFFRSKRAARAAEDVKVVNPFQLSSALKWALLFAVVLLVTKVAATWFGQGLTYVAGILAGATDVDAITLSMATLAARDQISDGAAVTTIYLGAASNTVVKVAMTFAAGGPAFGRRVLGALAVVLAAGGAGLLASSLL